MVSGVGWIQQGEKGGPAPLLSSIWAQITELKNVGPGTRTQVVKFIRPAVHNLMVAGSTPGGYIFSHTRRR